MEWGICCVCVTLVYYIRELFRKAVFIPILNNCFDDKSKMKTAVEDRRSSHRLDNYWWSWLGCTPNRRELVGDRPDVLGDRWICEVQGASGFVQTQNGLVNWLCVWHWISFCVINGYRLHGVVCLCGMLRCKWSRLLLKSRVLFREPHTLVVNQKRERTSGRACISF